MRTAAVLLTPIVILATACDAITDPKGPACASIRLESTGLSPRVGETVHVGATAVDQAGLAVAGATIGFTSSNPAVASVDASGAVMARSPGGTMITAAAACGPGGAVVTAAIAINVRANLVRLVIERTGTGTGSIFTTPSGSEFDAGTAVAITANPASGSQFDGWSGACASFGKALTCTVTMIEPGPVVVGAGFTRIDAFVSPTVSGTFGTVTGQSGCRWSLPYTGSLSLHLVQQPDGTLTGTASGTIQVNIQVTFTPQFQNCTASPFSHAMSGTASGSAASVTASAANAPNGTWRVTFTGTRTGDTITGTMVFSGTLQESGATNASHPVSSTVNGVQLIRS